MLKTTVHKVLGNTWYAYRLKMVFSCVIVDLREFLAALAFFVRDSVLRPYASAL